MSNLRYITEHIYTSRIQKGGALLDDMRLLVRSWTGKANDGQRQRVVAENVLGKRTRSRSVAVYGYAFAPRFLNGDPLQAWKIVRSLEDKNAQLEVVKCVYYWITARSDRILYDYVTEELMAHMKSVDRATRIDETVGWINQTLDGHNQTWSNAVTLRVAQGLLSTIRDFEILEWASIKRLAARYLPIEFFAYVAFALHQLNSHPLYH